MTGDVPEIDAITIRRAETPEDRETVFRVRFAGYRKYFQQPADVVDEFDHAPNCTLLLAELDGQPVGTMRILERTTGPVELDRFLDLDGLLNGSARNVAEATRLSVPHHPQSRWVKMLLWKSFMHQCRRNGISHMAIWAKRTAGRDYRNLLFTSLGPVGTFSHRQLGGVQHETFVNDLRDVEDRFRDAGHPLYEFMFVKTHKGVPK
jgi:hypothetical protein